MNLDTDVLIVGAGPTGLMLACQLARFGVSFRIIDKALDRAYESRAFGIQAKSMEIFQNLGIVNEFLNRTKIPDEASLYFNGKLKFSLNFKKIAVDTTPFPNIYLLPQSETEAIFAEHLEKSEVKIERQTELLSFSQLADGIEANIKNCLTQKTEIIQCRYIVGCDGAHSTVRTILNIPFVGASYQQEFILADVTVQWPYPKDNLLAFMKKNGFCVYIPLSRTYSRLVIAGQIGDAKTADAPNIKEIENFLIHELGMNVQLENPIWISRFHLHHRCVENYMRGRAFLAGDAAHVHSPIGAQGMNTGLQDAANLAWKIALVIKYQASTELLDTYQTERQRIGEILLKSTDRMFSILISKKPIIILLRQYVLPWIMRFLMCFRKNQKRFFCFVSELAIHYHKSPFLTEVIEGANRSFLLGPKAGFRAPDAPIGNKTLFETFAKKPFNILIFQTNSQLDAQQINNVKILEELAPDIIAVHKFAQTADTKTIFDRYGVTGSALYFIRPDGYIGFRAFGYQFAELLKYLEMLGFNNVLPSYIKLNQ